MQGARFSKEGFRRLHETMASYVAAGERPGLVTLLCRNGERDVDAIGAHEFGSGRPMHDTIFRIASITKPITGAVTMSLIEEGKLSLEEPVDRLIPELANRHVLKRLDGALDDTVPAKRPIRVRDLLTMRMGMGIMMSSHEFPGTDLIGLGKCCARAGSLVKHKNCRQKTGGTRAWVTLWGGWFSEERQRTEDRGRYAPLGVLASPM